MAILAEPFRSPDPKSASAERVDCGAAHTEDEVSLPTSRQYAIGSFSRTLTDHDLRRDKVLASPAYAPWASVVQFCSQAGRQLAAQRPAAVNEESLVDSFVTEAHSLVVRQVDRQALGDLLRAGRFGPSPILARAMPPAAVPRNGGTRNERATRSYDAPSKSLLYLGAQHCIERKRGRVGPAGGSIRMPLGSCCPIPQPAAGLRRSSRETVEAARPRRRPISCME